MLLTIAVNETCLVVNFAAKHEFLTSSKLFTKPTPISFCNAMILATSMLVVFGTMSYMKGLNRTFNITNFLDLKGR